jgi:hypothetical protein
VIGPRRIRRRPPSVSPGMRLRTYFLTFMLVAVDALMLVGCGKGKY